MKNKDPNNKSASLLDFGQNFTLRHGFSCQQELKIGQILQQFCSMKKVPLKITTNKKKLHINRPVCDQPKQSIAKNRPLKQNSNIFPKLQQKEENSNDRHKFQSIQNISTHKRISIISECDESVIKFNINHRPSSKLIRRRSSASLAVIQNNEPVIEDNVNISNQTFVEFVKLLSGKEILSIQQANCIISCNNLRTLLLYMITAKTQKCNNYAHFSTYLTSQTLIDNFFIKNKGPQCPPAPQKNCLKLCSKTIQVVSIGKSINRQLMKDLSRVASVLMQQVAALQKRKQAFQDQIKQQYHFLRENQHKNITIHLEIQSSKNQLQTLRQSLQNQKKLLSDVHIQKQKISNFVNFQSNLIAKGAAQYHKNLQIDLLEYADFLKHHPLGKKQFQPSIFYTEIERIMQIQVKQTVSSLTNAETSQNEKQDSLNDFLKRLRHQYKLMIDQLNRAITEKTKYIQKFTGFMHRWYQNYLAKKQYLSGLTEAFSLQAVTLQHLRQGIQLYCQESVLNGKAPTPSPACIAALKKIFVGIQKLVEIFGLGNSFY